MVWASLGLLPVRRGELLTAALLPRSAHPNRYPGPGGSKRCARTTARCAEVLMFGADTRSGGASHALRRRNLLHRLFDRSGRDGRSTRSARLRKSLGARAQSHPGRQSYSCFHLPRRVSGLVQGVLRSVRLACGCCNGDQPTQDRKRGLSGRAARHDPAGAWRWRLQRCMAHPWPCLRRSTWPGTAAPLAVVEKNTSLPRFRPSTRPAAASFLSE